MKDVRRSIGLTRSKKIYTRYRTTMNKNMRFILTVLVIGAFVLVAAHLYSTKYEGFDDGPACTVKASAGKCPSGKFCSYWYQSNGRCKCCDSDTKIEKK